ncbi:MAG: J domain-containing protein [Halobacteriales archaeon]
MVYDAAAVPGWLIGGLALGTLMTLVVAAVFAIGTRRFSDGRESAQADGGEDRRRAEIREYLGAIDEPFEERHVLAGEPVAFYLPDRDVAVTFDAQHYFTIDRTDTHAILVEYEMPGHAIGRRLPFDTPEATEVLPGETVEDAFDLLGVDPQASAEEVQAAYREQIKDVHPDHGGDRESFERVQEAYAVAEERVR